MLRRRHRSIAAGILVLPVVGLAGAACSARPAAPPPAPAVTGLDSIRALPYEPSLPDTMQPHRVPPFGDAPLVTWGPPPTGTEHPPAPRPYDLQHQVVRLRFDAARRAVVGSTTLRVAGASDSVPAASVALDAVGMTITRVAGNGGTALSHDYDGRVLVVHLAQPLRPRRTATIEIAYEAVAPTRAVHFAPERRAVWTSSGPSAARHWVPTVDDPAERATWEIVLRTPPDEMALSSGRLVASRRAGTGVEWHWRLDAPSPARQLSVAAGDFTVLQDRWRGLPLGYWTPPDSVAAAWRGFGKTPRMMDWLLGRTGIAYPWSKYDQVVVPVREQIDRALATVSTAIMAEDAILHPEWAEPHLHALSEGVVMHGLAHQWFGALVSIDDWSHAWIAEGFARMLEAGWREADHGADEAEYARVLVRDAALAADVRARRPLVWDRWREDPDELFAGDHLDARGAAVLEMLRARLGDSTFWAGTRAFVGAHRASSATSGDLRAALEHAAGTELARFFDQWVYGAGHPVFRVSYAVDTARRELTLTAEQVQSRDSLTGWFAVDVEVEVLTDAGSVRGVLASRDSIARLALALPALPRAIIWDRGARLLHVTDFPRPTAMLAHQLAQAATVPARLDAVRELARRVHEGRAAEALARAAREQPFWAIRVDASRALAGGVSIADAVLLSLLDASRDADPRVREAAVASLGVLGERLRDGTTVLLLDAARAAAGLPGGAGRAQVLAGVAARLDTLVATDASGFVRASALRALAAFDRERAVAAARPLLGRRSWLDLERRAAEDVLGASSDEGVRDPARSRGTGGTR